MATENVETPITQPTVHHKEPSWWQPIMGFSVILLGLGIYFIAKGIVMQEGTNQHQNLNAGWLFENTGFIANIPYDVLIGLGLIICFFIIFALRLLAETSPKRFKQDNADFEERMEEMFKEPRGFAKFSFIWVFLGSEVVFFTLLIGSGLALRIRTNGYSSAGNWIPAQHLNIPITAFNTFMLICSSYTMVKGLQWIEKGNSRKGSYFLFATVLFGLLFVSIQANEYLGLWASGFRPNPIGTAAGVNPLFPATFYIETGFHGLHVLFGVFIMFFVALKAYRGGYTADNHDSVELIGYYWHFVDLVWIILFTVVYLF